MVKLNGIFKKCPNSAQLDVYIAKMILPFNHKHSNEDFRAILYTNLHICS